MKRSILSAPAIVQAYANAKRRDSTMSGREIANLVDDVCGMIDDVMGEGEAMARVEASTGVDCGTLPITVDVAMPDIVAREWTWTIVDTTPGDA